MTPNVNQYAKPMQLTSGVGASAPLPNYQTALQQQAQQNVPNQGQYNGNPQGAYNMGQYSTGYAQGSYAPMPSSPYMNRQVGYNPSQYNMQYQGGQSPYLGRYTPPTMQPGSAFLQQGLYNSNQWNNQGGYQYNLPNSYGQTGLNYGQGQAPMPSYQGMAGQAQGAFAQQMFNDPSTLNPQDRAFYGSMGQMAEQAQGSYGQLQGQYNQNMGQMMNRQQWQGANAGVGSAPTVDDTATRQALFDQRANDLRQRQWNQVLEGRGGRVNFPGGG